MKELSRWPIKIWREKVGPKLLSLLSVLWLGGFSIAVLALWGFVALADGVLERQTHTNSG